MFTIVFLACVYFLYIIMRVILFFGSCFFFFKQKTAYEMRISDWSSDVCSSDLMAFAELIRPAHICLVPETRQELTTEGGLDVAGQEARISLADRKSVV